MKEELVEKAQVAMVDIIDTMVKAKDFAIDQAPDVISQLLTWSIVDAIVGLVIGVALSVSLVWVIPYSIKCWGGMNNEFGCITSTTYSLFAGVFGAALVIDNLMEVLKIWVAPKVWLIEYAASLAN